MVSHFGVVAADRVAFVIARRATRALQRGGWPLLVHGLLHRPGRVGHNPGLGNSVWYPLRMAVGCLVSAGIMLTVKNTASHLR